jgi:hypothetical protein
LSKSDGTLGFPFEKLAVRRKCVDLVLCTVGTSCLESQRTEQTRRGVIWTWYDRVLGRWARGCTPISFSSRSNFPKSLLCPLYTVFQRWMEMFWLKGGGDSVLALTPDELTGVWGSKTSGDVPRIAPLRLSAQIGFQRKRFLQAPSPPPPSMAMAVSLTLWCLWSFACQSRSCCPNCSSTPPLLGSAFTTAHRLVLISLWYPVLDLFWVYDPDRLQRGTGEWTDRDFGLRSADVSRVGCL